MKKILKQPLICFLFFGGGLFFLYGWVSTPEEVNHASRTIKVDREVLLTFMQYRAKAFNKEMFNEKLDAMTAAERRKLIDELVEEEALYREAIAQEMDRNDYVIKRRLVQKIRFIANGFGDALTEMNDDTLQQYFASNRDDYFIQPFVTFTHVFFSREGHGDAQARQLAEQKRDQLNRTRADFADSMVHGDRFLYHNNYIEREHDFVASHFGEKMTEAIVALSPDDQRWIGPLQSTHGYHVVMLTANQAGRYPQLQEVYGRVHNDARKAEIQKHTQQAIQSIIDNYTIIVSDGLNSDPESASEHLAARL
jgi:hypothetical protein